MDNAKPISVLLANHFRLFNVQCQKTYDEVKNMVKIPYASAMGCLMYGIVCARPYLAHVVNVISKFFIKFRTISLECCQVDLQIFEGYYRL